MIFFEIIFAPLVFRRAEAGMVEYPRSPLHLCLVPLISQVSKSP